MVDTIFVSTFGTTQNIVGARLFDTGGSLAYNISYSRTGFPEDELKFVDSLFPTDQMIHLLGSQSEEAIISGPLYNNYSSEYLMSMSLPVASNSTIFIDSNKLAGYLAIVYKSDSLKAIIDDSIGLNANGRMSVVTMENITNADGKVESYIKTVLPGSGRNNITHPYHPLDTIPVVKLALQTNQPGTILNSKEFGTSRRAVGYAVMRDFSATWVILVSEAHSTLYQSINTLRNITIIAGFSVLVGCVLVVIFCVNLGVRPIYKLKQAAEQTRQVFNTEDDGSIKTTPISSGAAVEPQKRMLIPARVQVSHHKFFTDELVSLQESFNRMADELEKQYTHLEDIVQERTKELRKAQFAAEAANEAKTSFIANITHELRTPLNGILGMTAISLTEEDPQKVQRSLKVISKSGMLLLNLLNDLLTFSKNQIGNIKLEEKEFYIDELVTQLNVTYSHEAKTKGIRFEYAIEPKYTYKSIVLLADPGRILHLLLNSVSNCLKFAPRESTIGVRIWLFTGVTHPRLVSADQVQHLSDGTLVLEVQDEGPGVEPEKLNQMFEPFVQGDQALSRKHGGAGLGLSICKQLTTLMHGKASLRNVSDEGGGLIVKFEIPVGFLYKPQKPVIEISDLQLGAAYDDSRVEKYVDKELESESCTGSDIKSFLSAAEPPSRHSSMLSSRSSLLEMPTRHPSYFELKPHGDKELHRPSSPSSVTTRIPKFLLADDNAINIQILTRMLLKLRPTAIIKTVSNGNSAVKEISEAIGSGYHFDVVFMDVKMPGEIDGIEAAIAARKQWGYGYPIVGITGMELEDIEMRDERWGNGMDMAIQKPISMEKVKDVIEKYGHGYGVRTPATIVVKSNSNSARSDS